MTVQPQIEQHQHRDLMELRAMVALVPNRERRALLIARNVESGVGQGTRTDRGRPLPAVEEVPSVKLSAARFAEALDSDLMRRSTVSAALLIWNFAADELGVLPHSDTLSPGDQIDWPGGWTWAGIAAEYKAWKPDKRPDRDKRPDLSDDAQKVNKALTTAMTAFVKIVDEQAAIPADQRENLYGKWARFVSRVDRWWEENVVDPADLEAGGDGD